MQWQGSIDFQKATTVKGMPHGLEHVPTLPAYTSEWRSHLLHTLDDDKLWIGTESTGWKEFTTVGMSSDHNHDEWYYRKTEILPKKPLPANASWIKTEPFQTWDNSTKYASLAALEEGIEYYITNNRTYTDAEITTQNLPNDLSSILTNSRYIWSTLYITRNDIIVTIKLVIDYTAKTVNTEFNVNYETYIKNVYLYDDKINDGEWVKDLTSNDIKFKVFVVDNKSTSGTNYSYYNRINVNTNNGVDYVVGDILTHDPIYIGSNDISGKFRVTSVNETGSILTLDIIEAGKYTSNINNNFYQTINTTGIGSGAYLGSAMLNIFNKTFATLLSDINIKHENDFAFVLEDETYDGETVLYTYVSNEWKFKQKFNTKNYYTKLDIEERLKNIELDSSMFQNYYSKSEIMSLLEDYVLEGSTIISDAVVDMRNIAIFANPSSTEDIEDGTTKYPFKTIAAAIEDCPNKGTIYLEFGEYGTPMPPDAGSDEEDMYVTKYLSFHGGGINNVTINGDLNISLNASIFIQDLTLNGNIDVASNSAVYLSNVRINGTIHVAEDSKISADNVEINNQSELAIDIVGSSAFLHNIRITDSGYSVRINNSPPELEDEIETGLGLDGLPLKVCTLSDIFCKQPLDIISGKVLTSRAENEIFADDLVSRDELITDYYNKDDIDSLVYNREEIDEKLDDIGEAAGGAAVETLHFSTRPGVGIIESEFTNSLETNSAIISGENYVFIGNVHDNFKIITSYDNSITEIPNTYSFPRFIPDIIDNRVFISTDNEFLIIDLEDKTVNTVYLNIPGTYTRVSQPSDSGNVLLVTIGNHSESQIINIYTGDVIDVDYGYSAAWGSNNNSEDYFNKENVVISEPFDNKVLVINRNATDVNGHRIVNLETGAVTPIIFGVNEFNISGTRLEYVSGLVESKVMVIGYNRYGYIVDINDATVDYVDLENFAFSIASKQSYEGYIFISNKSINYLINLETKDKILLPGNLNGTGIVETYRMNEEYLVILGRSQFFAYNLYYAIHPEEDYYGEGFKSILGGLGLPISASELYNNKILVTAKGYQRDTGGIINVSEGTYKQINFSERKEMSAMSSIYDNKLVVGHKYGERVSIINLSTGTVDDIEYGEYSNGYIFSNIIDERVIIGSLYGSKCIIVNINDSNDNTVLQLKAGYDLISEINLPSSENSSGGSSNSDVDLSDYYDKEDINAKLTEYYTKTEADSAISTYAYDKANTYTKSETDSAISTYAYAKANTYTKTETDSAVSTYAYAKANTYTKSEVYAKSEVYTKSEINTNISTTVATFTYTKSELDTMIGNINTILDEINGEAI
jgi:uncharacterized protein (UPF0297 family)